MLSAPCPRQREDRDVVLSGLDWIEQEAQKRFTRSFSFLSDSQRAEICNDIRFLSAAKPGFEVPAQFFARYRVFTAGGF